MRSAIAIAAFLGAGAIAHPSFQYRHPHNKRDTFVTSTQGNEVIVEDIKDVVVTVIAGQLPTGQPSIPLAAPEKLAVEAPPAAPLSVTPIAASTQPSPLQPASSAPVVAAAPASAPAASSPEGSGTFWATSPMSPLGGGSGAKDVLTQANYWRKQWRGLPPFTWSSVLANNSYMTATQPIYDTTQKDSTGKNIQVAHNEGGGVEMNHELYPGSSSQCISSGDDTTVTQQGLTSFELAFLRWICEAPNSNINDQCQWLCEPYIPGLECNWGPQKPTTEGESWSGHADIIGGTVSQIGCYYMEAVEKKYDWKGLWTCDFAG